MSVAEKRIVYKIPKMDEVEVQRNVRYHTINDTALTMDIYYPPGVKPGSQLPTVIFVFGYADSTMSKMSGYKLKDFVPYICWGQLTAASGLVAVTYETQQPETDIDELLRYIRQNAASLRIDENRIGIWSCSGNVPTALSVLMDESRNYLKCAVLYYGYMLDWNGSSKVAKAADKFGFVYPKMRKSFDNLRRDIPLFIVRAGLDEVPNLNETIDRFLDEALSRNIPIVFHNYFNGHHGFDIVDDNDSSREIIKQTIGFMRTHLFLD